jgi:hypothetical protein
VPWESSGGILCLVVMHLAIAVVTYNTLVRIAPAGKACLIPMSTEEGKGDRWLSPLPTRCRSVTRVLSTG